MVPSRPKILKSWASGSKSCIAGELGWGGGWEEAWKEEGSRISSPKPPRPGPTSPQGQRGPVPNQGCWVWGAAAPSQTSMQSVADPQQPESEQTHCGCGREFNNWDLGFEIQMKTRSRDPAPTPSLGTRIHCFHFNRLIT